MHFLVQAAFQGPQDNTQSKYYYLDSLDFSDCVSLTTIADNAFQKAITEKIIFSGCKNLESIGTDAFDEAIPSELDFSDCENLVSISNAFNDKAPITKLNFEGCTKLTSIGRLSGSSLDELDLSSFTSLTNPGYIKFNNGAVITLTDNITSHFGLVTNTVPSAILINTETIDGTPLKTELKSDVLKLVNENAVVIDVYDTNDKHLTRKVVQLPLETTGEEQTFTVPDITTAGAELSLSNVTKLENGIEKPITSYTVGQEMTLNFEFTVYGDGDSSSSYSPAEVNFGKLNSTKTHVLEGEELDIPFGFEFYYENTKYRHTEPGDPQKIYFTLPTYKDKGTTYITLTNAPVLVPDGVAWFDKFIVPHRDINNSRKDHYSDDPNRLISYVSEKLLDIFEWELTLYLRLLTKLKNPEDLTYSEENDFSHDFENSATGYIDLCHQNTGE